MTRHYLTTRVLQSGFTLVEIMISLALGLIISTAIIQVMVSNSMTQRLNRAVASTQESGRYIISRVRTELLMVGMYDGLSPKLNRNVDIAEEAVFLRNHPIPIAGDFIGRLLLGSRQGVGGTSDVLVVSFQGEKDCRGFNLGYSAAEEFFVVNEYFVSDGKLKCRGFDGRVLRGQKSAQGHNNHGAYTILDDVLSFQVSFGLTDLNNHNAEAIPEKYIDASQLAAAFGANKQVVAIHLAIVIKGEGDISLDKKMSFKLLNEEEFTAPDKGLYKAFETSVSLRNVKNYIKGNA